MIHFIYKTTNLSDGSYYIGKHTTKRFVDGYLGSGKILLQKIKKYGKENFTREILEYAVSERELNSLEEKYVNIDVVSDPKSYNLTIGGFGGTKHLNNGSEESISWKSKGARSTITKHHKMLSVWGSSGGRKTRDRYDSFVRKQWSAKGGCVAFLGKNHTEESRKKISASRLGQMCGEKNGAYGTCWIKKGTDTLRIPKEKIKSYLEDGWERGRCEKRR